MSEERGYWRKTHSFANIRGILGVVMKKKFQLYLVARGDGGEKWLELLIGANSRRFFLRHGKKSVGVQRFWRGLYQRFATAGIYH
jgi:hypothetical protein